MSAYAEGSIAAVTLESGGDPVKAVIIEGANFQLNTVGNHRFAVDGTVHSQFLTVTEGIAFGVKLEFCPPDLLADIIAAIDAAVAASTPFNVTLADDFNSINADCFPDFSGPWLTYPEQRTSTITLKDIVFRFITV